jgi:aconitate hydratase
VLRNCDGKKVRRKDVETLANWNAKATANEEIPFVVARIVLQDFTGVPLVVDLAAMRSAVKRLGGDPKSSSRSCRWISSSITPCRWTSPDQRRR